jgi:hypothetical protein
LENIAVKMNRSAPAEYSALSTQYSSGPWTRFWFTPVQPIGLHWLRVLSCILFICWLLPFAGHQAELFGLGGWLDREAYVEMSQLPGGPPTPIGWSLAFLSGDNTTLLTALWLGAIIVFALFGLGMATRITSVLTWIMVISFVGNPATQFDADFLLVILAFYLMIGYVLLGQWSGEKTLRNRLVCNRGTCLSPWNQANPRPSYAANLAVRLLQVHFAIVVFTSCLHKLQFGDWWSGVALWYPLHNPFTMNAERLLAEAQHAESTLFFLSLAQYIMLAWQITFPFFAWRPRWRWLLLSGGVVGWIGSIFIYGEPLFGPIYLIGCLSYLTADEWQSLTSRAAGLVQRLTGGLSAAPEKKIGVR